ncbi:hypothetical protein, partial [Pseudodesulfovibrio sp. JC047]|uniref:hypothetical protein n=1 Tax=Pseudodesulfovibrio sp. JC047 TaxID=2683199 RepID=UPI00193FBC0C
PPLWSFSDRTTFSWDIHFGNSPPESVKFEITICAKQKAGRRKGETFEIIPNNSLPRSAQCSIKTKNRCLFLLSFLHPSIKKTTFPSSGPLLEANPPPPFVDPYPHINICIL